VWEQHSLDSARDGFAYGTRDIMQGRSIQLEDRSSWSLFDCNTTVIALSTMDQAHDEGVEIPQERGPSSHSSVYEGHHPPRNETGLSQDTQDSGTTVKSIHEEQPANAQSGLLHSDRGDLNLIPRSFGRHQQIRYFQCALLNMRS
jgi:hypothetical protein